MNILVVIALFFAVAMVVTGLSIAPWVPCKRKNLYRIHKIADLKPGEIFYELGSGDGRVSFFVAKHNPHAKVVGIEMNPWLYAWTKFKKVFHRLPNLEIKLANALNHDISKANVVYTFAMIESINKVLKKKFLNELTPGSRIISYVFTIKNWPGNYIKNQPSKKNHSIHLYQIPNKL